MRESMIDKKSYSLKLWMNNTIFMRTYGFKSHFLAPTGREREKEKEEEEEASHQMIIKKESASKLSLTY